MTQVRTDWLQRLFSRAIAIPVNAFAGALATDLAYAASATLLWSNFSAWLLLAGLIAGVAALMVWALDLRVRGGTPVRIVTLLVLIGATIAESTNFMIHMRDGWTAVVPEGLALSIVGTVLIVLAAWLWRTK